MAQPKQSRAGLASFTALTTVLIAPSAVWAQQAASSSDGTAAPKIETVVVTATRGYNADTVQVGTFRNARILDVPLTVNVVPQAILKAQAAEGLFDGLRNTAGVSRAQTNGVTFDNVSIRGIRVENRTSFRLNGALPVINLVDLPIENKERFEALKGVGAVYYGFGPPSGIINLVTKRANVDVTNFVFSANSHGSGQASVDVGRKMTDRFGLRFNGSLGVIQAGIDNFSGERQVAALALDYRASDRLSLKFDIEHVHKDITEPGVIQLNAANSPLTPPATVGVRVLPPLPKASLNLGGEQLRSDAKATNFLARVDFELSDQYALTLEAGRAETTRNRDSGVLRNFDLRTGTPGFGTAQLVVSRARNQNFVNQTLRAELAGVSKTGPLTHNLIIGASANWRDQNGASSPGFTVAQNYFNPVDVRAQLPTSGTFAPLEVLDAGLYVTDRITWGPVNLILGARHSDYDSYAVSATGVVTEFQVTKTTPIVGFVYNLTDKFNIYGSYLQGLEETPPAPTLAANAFEVLAPSQSDQYELGFKGSVTKGLLLQVAAFQIERTSAFVDPLDNRFKLAGREEYKGVEASLVGEISRSASIALSGQYLDAAVTSAVTPILLGKRPENTAEWTGSAFVELHPESWGGFAIGAGAFYNSDRPVNIQNEAFVPAHTLMNAMVRYEFKLAERNLALQLNAENLTDEGYWAGTGNNQLSVGLPRTFKLTLRVSN